MTTQTQSLPSSALHALFHWGFGRGFWYVDPLKEVKGLTDEQLFWTPSPGNLCILWHVGHIAHRERVHIGWLLQGRSEAELIPAPFSVFGPNWVNSEAIRQSIGSVDAVRQWVGQVRQQTHEYIAGLKESDFHCIPASSVGGNTIGEVLIQTIGHTGVHIGRIQLLRAMLENKRDRPC